MQSNIWYLHIWIWQMTQVPTNQSANPNQFGAPMDDCREQEEEWEREGLLDPAWEKQQRKVWIKDMFMRNEIFLCAPFLILTKKSYSSEV